MNVTATPRNILISWVGNTDLKACRGEEEVGIGPVAQAVSQRDFDLIVLLSNYPKKETAGFTAWLEQYSQSPTELNLVKLTGPTNFGEIYEVAVKRIQAIQEEHGDSAKLTYHLSPGTPAMAAVWIIIAKTRYAAELIETSREHGLRTATIPFDISAEFIPELLKRPDRDLERLSAGLTEETPEFSAIIHRSTVIKQVIAKAHRVAPRSVPVLIEGESGTGKELLARAIHKASPRAGKPFIAVNCGAISPELAESELFGHKKGAFTGAATERKGHFETASGGTLFLDEIGELPLTMQVKLLRVLQENAVVRVGTSDPISVDVRIIAATNRNLAEQVSVRKFRADLFYRIAVAVLKLPPIRERAGDINLLIDHALAKVNKDSAAEPDWKEKKISAGARNLLQQHPWPGNVRELINTLTRAAVWSSEATISKEDAQYALLEIPSVAQTSERILHRPFSEDFNLNEIMGEVARHYMERALNEAGNNKSKAAKLVGLGSYQTLNNWLEKYRASSR